MVADLLIQHGAEVDILHDGKAALHRAVEDGDETTVRQIIEQNGNINIQDHTGQTPLHYASYRGNKVMVNLLLDLGAIPDIEDNLGRIPFDLAFESQSDTKSVLDLFIKYRDKENNTLLHLAVKKGRLSTVQNLSKEGADIYAKNNEQQIPLHLAAFNGNLDVLNELINLGSASLCVRDSRGRYPLHLAVLSGYLNIVKRLVELLVDVSVVDKLLQTPLHFASINGSVSTVEVLTDAGADVNAQDMNGVTPLWLATEVKSLDKIRELKKKGADINIRNKYGWQVLHLSSEMGDLELVRELESLGADVYGKNDESKIPFQLTKEQSVIDFFIKWKDKGRQDTLLHYASREDNVNLVQLLIDSGFDLDVKNKFDWTALNVAIHFGSNKVSKLLKEKGALEAIYSEAKYGTHAAVQNGNIEVVTEALNSDLSVINSRDNLNNTLLHYAALYGRVDIVELLIEKNADANAKNYYGVTPLHLSCAGEYVGESDSLATNYLNAVRKLAPLSDVNAMDVDGNTPLGFAARKGHLSITKELIKSNANPALKNNNQRTPFELAVSYGQQEIIQYYKEYRDNRNNTLLHIAAQICNTELVDSLLLQNADINVKNDKGNLPLHEAVLFTSSRSTFNHSTVVDVSNGSKNNSTVVGVDISPNSNSTVVGVGVSPNSNSTVVGVDISPNSNSTQNSNSTVVDVGVSPNSNSTVVGVGVSPNSNSTVVGVGVSPNSNSTQNSNSTVVDVGVSPNSNSTVVGVDISPNSNSTQNSNSTVVDVGVSPNSNSTVVGVDISPNSNSTQNSNSTVVDVGVSPNSNSTVVGVGVSPNSNSTVVGVGVSPNSNSTQNSNSTVVDVGVSPNSNSTVVGVDISPNSNSTQNSNSTVVDVGVSPNSNSTVVGVDISPNSNSTQNSNSTVVDVGVSPNSNSTVVGVDISPNSNSTVVDVGVSPNSNSTVVGVDISPNSNSTVVGVGVSPNSNSTVVGVGVSPNSNSTVVDVGVSPNSNSTVVGVDISPNSNSTVVGVGVSPNSNSTVVGVGVSPNSNSTVVDVGVSPNSNSTAVDVSNGSNSKPKVICTVDSSNINSTTTAVNDIPVSTQPFHAEVNGNLTLCIAVKYMPKLVSCTQVVEKLTDQGSDVDSFNFDGCSSVHLAARLGKLDVVKILVRQMTNINLKQKNSIGNTAMHEAAQNDHLSVLEFLIDEGALVDIENRQKNTPLHLAALSDHLDIIKLLLERKADLLKENKDGRTPFELAVQAGASKIIDFFTKDYRDELGNTILHLVLVKKNFVRLVPILLDKGASVCSRNSNGDVALHIAIKQSLITEAREIMGKMSSYHVVNNEGMTPLHLVTSKNLTVLVDELLVGGNNVDDKDKKENTPLFFAVGEGNVIIMKKLIEKKANVNVTNVYGNTPLHDAVINNKLDVVKVLIKANAHINVKNNASQTPLDLAVDGYHVDVTLELVEAGGSNFFDFINQQIKSLCRKVSTQQSQDDIKRFSTFIQDVLKRKFKSTYSPYLFAQECKLSIAKFVVDEYAGMGAEGNDHRTPLHVDNCHVDLDMINAFLDKNVSVNTKVDDVYLMMTTLTLVKKNITNQAGTPSNVKRWGQCFVGELRFQIKNKTQMKLGNDILYNSYDSFKKLGDTIYETDQKLFDDTMKETINNVYRKTYTKKILVFIGKLTYTDQRVSCSSALLDVLKKNNYEGSYELFQLALYVKELISLNDASPLYKTMLEQIKAKLPEAVRNIVFVSEVCIKNIERNEYLYADEYGYRINYERRAVFTWIPRNKSNDGGFKWKFECNPDYNVCSLKNVKYNEYLYAVGEEWKYDSERRYVATWMPGGKRGGSEFYIEFKGDNYYMKSLSYQEYFYAALYAPYDEKRRRVFTWFTHEKPSWSLWSAENCAHIVKRRDISNSHTDLNSDTTRSSRKKAELEEKLLSARKIRDLSKVKDLINEGDSINDEDKGGSKTLYSAAEISGLNNGTNIEAKNGKCQATPLHGNRRVDLAKLFLNNYFDIDANANLGAKGNYGKTPLDIAKDKENNNIVEYLEKKLREERGEPLQRKRRHHYGDHNHHHMSRKPLAIDSSNQPEVATSSAIKPSSWINDLFNWVKGSVGGLLNSKPTLSKETSNTSSPISQVDAKMDVNGTIMLLDVLVRKVTGQKYVSTVDQPISSLKAQGYALNITKGFEKVVEQAGLKSGVSMHRLNIDFVEIQKEVTGKIMSGKFNEISGILKSYVEKACPDEEAGKLSPKKFEKFIAQFNKGLLNQSIEQILHNRDGRLEVDGTKKQQISLEPQSYLSNASVHSHSEVSTCLSEIGVTKLGGNLNR